MKKSLCEENIERNGLDLEQEAVKKTELFEAVSRAGDTVLLGYDCDC